MKTEALHAKVTIYLKELEIVFFFIGEYIILEQFLWFISITFKK